MPFTVTVLGSNSAIPTSSRFPTSQLLNVNEHYYLIDCGEGTQIQLRRFKIKFQRIKAIFISHLHGDHFFGLPGLLTTMSLLGRESKLEIFAPPQLEQIINVMLEPGKSKLSFPITYKPLLNKTGNILLSDQEVEVSEIKLSHRIKCSGFLFKTAIKPYSIKKVALKQYNLTIDEIKKIKKGGLPIRLKSEKFSDIVNKREEPKTYAFCTDTKPLKATEKAVFGANLLYHEATFLQTDAARAKSTYHTTALQAAQLAKQAQVKNLMIGHYSTRYKNIDNLLEEAQQVFTKTKLAIEGETTEVL